jgi:hypothetical protein
MTFLNQHGNVSWQNSKVHFAATAKSAMNIAYSAFSTASTGVWKAPKKSVWAHLTYFSLIVRLQMVRHFLKVWDRAGDSQSGLKYSKEQIL